MADNMRDVKLILDLGLRGGAVLGTLVKSKFPKAWKLIKATIAEELGPDVVTDIGTEDIFKGEKLMSIGITESLWRFQINFQLKLESLGPATLSQMVEEKFREQIGQVLDAGPAHALGSEVLMIEVLPFEVGPARFTWMWVELRLMHPGKFNSGRWSNYMSAEGVATDLDEYAQKMKYGYPSEEGKRRVRLRHIRSVEGEVKNEVHEFETPGAAARWVREMSSPKVLLTLTITTDSDVSEPVVVYITNMSGDLLESDRFKTGAVV